MLFIPQDRVLWIPHAKMKFTKSKEEEPTAPGQGRYSLRTFSKSIGFMYEVSQLLKLYFHSSVAIKKRSKVPGVMITQFVEEIPAGKSHPDFSRKPIALTIQEGTVQQLNASVILKEKTLWLCFRSTQMTLLNPPHRKACRFQSHHHWKSHTNCDMGSKQWRCIWSWKICCFIWSSLRRTSITGAVLSVLNSNVIIIFKGTALTYSCHCSIIN